MHWSFLLIALAVLLALVLDSYFGISGILRGKPTTAAA